MDGLIDTLKEIGATKDKLLLGIKNANAPAGPGKAAGPLGKDAAGNPVRYSKTGEPPTPVASPKSPANPPELPITTIDSKIKKLR